MVLARAITKEGLKKINKRANRTEIRKFIMMAVDVIKENILKVDSASNNTRKSCTSS